MFVRLTSACATVVLAVTALAATGTAATAAPSPKAEAALEQCGLAAFKHTANNWYGHIPVQWETNNQTNCNLKLGDLPQRDPSTPFGDPAGAIKALQRNLNYCYRAGLTIDGKYGARTFAAVKEAQRRHGLTVDGVYGPRTLAGMNWRLYNSYSKTWSQKCYSPF
ncbi:peptidoglycan-binding domain-containing protein [Kribbella deserti]|uniref:Peptidoglycan-binding protein n=1 Tax=Kribbella deserti TaxID=1926257 RepID=A0ABV6QW05_9ACTN